MQLANNMTLYNDYLSISGVSVQALKEKYGSPLYIIDQKGFEDRVKLFQKHFKSEKFNTRIIYASKAFLCTYLGKLINQLNLAIDVVSGGELYTALNGGINPEQIYFHGNNKLLSELTYALEKGVGTIVVDNWKEYQTIQSLAKKPVRVLLRVNPGIEAHTHEYIQTAKHSSKFGLAIDDSKTNQLIQAMAADPLIDFAGLHCHIGSQVFEEKSFFKEAQVMISYASQIQSQLNLRVKELNLGGGFGVYYTDQDKPFEYKDFLKNYIRVVEKTIDKEGLDLDIVSIEPGRSLINDFGTTIYDIGIIKPMPNYQDFIFIDGGMVDNPRPSLYGANYEAAIDGKITQKPHQTYSIAGKCCESSDVLIKRIDLPQAVPHDTLVVPRTGSYTYSMSSNYNKIPRPAVVFVKDGQDLLVIERESYEDLLRNEVTTNENIL